MTINTKIGLSVIIFFSLLLFTACLHIGVCRNGFFDHPYSDSITTDNQNEPLSPRQYILIMPAW
ncbi:hypothetical protein FLK61_29285 [Paenalkalicoccus suaedae]|uniref:Lipoprotein n=1 Tax=Paenalkalicoccus suaedae TaxID=2592382 RepID=A0A859FDA2_9BACI|nr:hypothetical protein [Paenalkalicoccus suaedae]QKS70828.1 hypothetical protein FLK61_29285 [Paenalkalicoccus suaedae]